MASDQAAPVPAGWYPDPYKASELRWWDGQSWTDSIHPPVAPAPVAPPAAPTPEPTPEPQPAVQSEPVQSEPVQSEPVQSEPVHATPVQATPVETSPVDEAPVETTPVYEVPVEAVPAQAFSDQTFSAQAAPTVEEPRHETAPAQQSPATQTPAPEAPPLVEPPLESPVVTAPPVSAATGALPDTTPPAYPSGTTLPSRREMRARASVEAEATNAAPTAAPLSPPASAPDPVSTPDSAVPDSATPTAFDWLNVGNGQPLGVVPPAASPEVAPPTEPDAPIESAQPTPIPAATQAPAATEPSAASMLGSDVLGAETLGAGDSGALPVPASNAWAQDPSAAAAASDEIFSPPAERTSTVAGWIIALTPLIGAFLVLGGVKGAENYPRYAPAGVEWWMIAGGVIAVLYIATIVLAIFDRRKLDWSGYNQPAHWFWAILTAPVYLLVRTFAVKRETGKNSFMLWAWIASAALVAGGWFATRAFAPEFIDGYVLPFV